MGRPEKKYDGSSEDYLVDNSCCEFIRGYNQAIDAYEEWIAECLSSGDLHHMLWDRCGSDAVGEILAFLKEKMIGGSKP